MTKFTKKCMAIRTLSDKASGWLYISQVNFEAFKSLYLSKNLPHKHQTWGFCESRCALSDYVAQ